MANTKLVLIEDVENLGKSGDEVSVAPGFARNYLLPNGLATKATAGTLRMIASKKEKVEQNRQIEHENAKTLATKIAETEISIQMQASDDDQLFGSVNARNIAEKMAEAGINVEYQRIKLDEPIKKLGMYTVDVKLHADVVASAKIWVVRA
ncbi:MAG: 50S ribosomal protein L9 [Victivallaceae bacterium]